MDLLTMSEPDTLRAMPRFEDRDLAELLVEANREIAERDAMICRLVDLMEFNATEKYDWDDGIADAKALVRRQR